VAKSSTSASGIFDDQDQKDDSEEDIETEEPFEKNEEFGSEIEKETKKGNSFLSELSSKIGGAGGSVKSKKKDQEKIIEEDNRSIKSNTSSKSIKSNVSKSLFDSDSDDDLFTAR
jgi:chitinase